MNCQTFLNSQQIYENNLKKFYLFFNFKKFLYIYICMDKKESKSEDINIRLTPFLKEQYKKYCKENNIDMSKHIREFIEKEINKCKS